MFHQRGITIVEVLVVVLILVVAAVLLLPALSGRSRSRQMQGSSQIRGIITGFLLNSLSNKKFCIGRKDNGSLAPQADVAWRFRTLIEANFFNTEYVQSPKESTPAAGYSYDLVSLADTTGQRFDGWRLDDTTPNVNANALMVSDRLFSGTPGQPSTYRSIHTTSPGDWRGSVGYHDGHVNFEATAILPTNDGKNDHPKDDIFAAESADDALMVYSGT